MKDNKQIAKQCFEMMTTLVKTVKETNELRNKWEGAFLVKNPSGLIHD